MDNLRCKASSVSVFLALNLFSNSSIDGALINIYNGSKELCFICFTPCTSTSNTQILPAFCTSSTAHLLKILKKICV